MGNRNVCRWFIEPKSPYTNNVVYQNLRQIGQTLDPTVIKDARGKTHEVWEVNYFFISYLQKAQIYSKLEFDVFLKTDDIVIKWRLHEPAIKKKAHQKRLKKPKGGRHGRK